MLYEHRLVFLDAYLDICDTWDFRSVNDGDLRYVVDEMPLTKKVGYGTKDEVKIYGRINFGQISSHQDSSQN